MARRSPSAPPPLAGFSYVHPLGTGGFADVFLYQQQMPRRQVAVKVLLRNLVDDEVTRMFNAEADVMARLGSHPGIVTVYEAGIAPDGRPYIAMEHCPVAMSQRYKTETIPVAEVLRIGISIAGAVESAHRAGVLHRDIKPSNILVTTFGAPVLADFGIATSLASTSSVLAMSVPWSAPEVVTDTTPGTVTTEVWSLGATVYTLLAGRSPFEVDVKGGNVNAELVKRVAKAAYTPIGRADVPPQLEAVLKQSMSRSPQDRQPTAADLAVQLQQVEHLMGLPVTRLEVAQAESAFSAPPVDFADVAERGAVRSHVPVVSPRAPRRQRVTAHTTDLTQDAPRRAVPVAAAAWVGAGLVAVIAGLVAWIVLSGH